MRAPPPVEYTSTLGRGWRVALSLLVGASVAIPLAWGLPYFAAHWGSRYPDMLSEALANPLVLGALALWTAAMVVAATWLARQAASAGERTLRWDGQDWVLVGAGPGQPDLRGAATLVLDLGPWMLVRFLPGTAAGFGAGAGTWLPLTLAGDLLRWAALRGALWNWRAGRGERRP